MTNTEKTLRAAIIRAWTDRRPCTQAALAIACTAAGEDLTQRQVGIYFTRWAERGLCETQVASNGRQGAAFIFNWTGDDIDAMTLRDLAEPVLVQADGAPCMDEYARKVRTALRYALGVDEIGTDAALLEACADVGARELHELPQRAYEEALERSSKRNAENCRSAVRRLMREAAEAGRVGVVLEKTWPEDAWTAARDRYFGAAVGTLSQRMRAYRCYWNHLAEGANELNLAKSPAELTPAIVDQVCDRHWEQGRTYLRNQIRTMLKWVAREHGEGPYAGYVHQPGATWTHNGWRNPGRLLGEGGRAGTGNWEALLDQVDAAGFSHEWRDFLAWYGEFVTLPFAEVERRFDRFPTRPPRWGLKRSTVVKRIIDIRTILYQAPAVLGKKPTEISPLELLGPAHRPFVAHLRTWWAERAKDPTDGVSSPNSDGLEKLVLSYALLAYALHLRLRHDRSAAPRQAADHRLLIQAGAQLTATEGELFEAYRAAEANAKEIEAARMRESNAHGDNTVRDLPRLIRTTPASFWIALLDEMLREVQAQVEFSADGHVLAIRAKNAHTFWKFVADAYYHGWLISTGMRISETGHVRLDLQYSPQLRGGKLREAHLRAIDRKETQNTLPHETAIRDRYVPRWLEALYLERARPFFMREWPELKDRPIQEHPWLFVDARGRPYGCPEEAADGSGRDPLQFATRLGHLRKRWQARCAHVAVAIDRVFPAMPREAVNHAVRIGMGYQIRQELGLTAAANYLGDKEESVEGVYAGVSGRLVDASVLAGEYADWEPPTRRAAKGNAPAAAPETVTTSAIEPPHVATLRSRLEDLTRQYEEGGIELDAYMARAKRLEEAMRRAA